MCKAFSCIVDQSAKVYWKFATDSHTDLLKLTPFTDQTADPKLMEFARVEITPQNGSYLNPDVWVYKIDESITPIWAGKRHEEACYAAHKKWLAKLNKIPVRKECIHPFRLDPPEIGPKQIALLKKWASVWASVGASVGAYTGSFFTIPTWKYVKHPKGKYPYAPLVKLWEQGIVPSFDGKNWRLHTKNGIAFEIAKDKL